MAGELVASAVVKELVSKLGSGLWSELGLLWNFSNDLEDMKSTLQSIGAVLSHAEKRSFNDEPVRLWLKRLKAAAYDIEDMFDQLPTHNRLLYSPIIAHKLKGMRKRLDKIAEERNNYSLRVEAITYQQQVIEGRETYSTVSRDDVLGREEEATKIINMLLSTTSDATSIIPIVIVGLGGLGKTTLAKLIFNDDKINKDFGLRIWVHAADFNVEKLAETILSSAGTGNGNRLTNLEAKTKEARKVLDGKKFLIVLDDVWNENKQKWVEFKEILQDGQKESKIVVTTRSESVSSIMDATETQHKLKPLSYDVCLELFERRAFRLAGAKDNHLASIGKDIVKKCQGVPLTAMTLGGMLHFQKGEAAWKKVRDSDIWELKEEEGGSSLENEIISSLQLSYQHMPSSPLKLCFIYFSSYPKAFKLDKDMLIQQWIAQRFIQTEDEVEALQIGDSYVNYLLSISFLEEEEREEFRNEDAKTYMKMHDLVYDLARSVAGNEVSVLDATESGKANAMECRYASVIKSNGLSKEFGKALLQKVRALHFQNCISRALHFQNCTSRALHFQDCTSLPKGIFSYTKCLRVLDFTHCYLDEVPSSVYKLKQLRYLQLPDYLEVDEQIGKLWTLESLIMSRSHAIHTLPTSIGKLHNLIYLAILYSDELSEIPYSIGSLQKLNNLKLVGCDMLRSLPESLGNLVKLATLTIYNCGALTSLPESLGNLVELETLDIRQCSRLKKIPESLGNLVKLTIYDCIAITNLPKVLSNAANLKTLDIRKWPNSALLASIWKLNNLMDLDLSFSDKLMELPDSIGELQKLYSLKLYGCDNLGSLPESLGNLMELRTLDIQGCVMLDLDELPTAICNMRHLKIQRDETLELFEFDTSVLKLHLIYGPQGGHVLRHVTDAKRINLKERGGSIKSLTYRCGGKNERAVEAMLEALQPHQNLQELRINDYEGSMFPSWMTDRIESFLPNLVKITLKDISNCEHLPELGQLPKLEEIVINDMPKIRRISEELCGPRNTTAGASFPSLKRLELRKMSRLEELVTAAMTGDDGERGPSLFPCLEDLTIEDCPKLRRIHPCIPPSVKRLELWKMDELEEWVTAAMARDDGERGASLFPCLEDLTIRDCPKLRRIHPCIPPSVRRLSLCSIENNLLSLVDVSNRIKYLHIQDYGLAHFRPSIRRLTSLETLKLERCIRLTTFPEWLGELCQLQHLDIYQCPYIDRLPQSIQGLTALTRLCITGSRPSLLERTRKGTGEDWDKISHIDNIEITSRRGR